MVGAKAMSRCSCFTEPAFPKELLYGGNRQQNSRIEQREENRGFQLRRVLLLH